MNLNHVKISEERWSMLGDMHIACVKIYRIYENKYKWDVHEHSLGDALWDGLYKAVALLQWWSDLDRKP